MELNARKRRRSDDGFLSGLQTKVYVNEQIRDKIDENAMKQVYDKTFEKLYQGARNLKNDSKNNNNNNNNNKRAPNLSAIYILSGNGILQYIEKVKDRKILATDVKRNAKCCNKPAYVTKDCTDCNHNICEHCGFSCTGCFKYLCVNCILWPDPFSNYNPICKFCKMFE